MRQQELISRLGSGATWLVAARQGRRGHLPLIVIVA